MKFKILSETAIPAAELKEKLEAISKEDTLNFRANKTYEYLNEFVEMGKNDAEELIGKIKKLNTPRLKDEHIVKLADLKPKTAEEVKVILQGYPITISKENLAKLAEQFA